MKLAHYNPQKIIQIAKKVLYNEKWVRRHDSFPPRRSVKTLKSFAKSLHIALIKVQYQVEILKH